MYFLKRSITYVDGSTDNIESNYTNFEDLQTLLRGCLVNQYKSVTELVITLENVK